MLEKKKNDDVVKQIVSRHISGLVDGPHGFMSMALVYPVGTSLMSLFIGPIGESFNISSIAVSIQFSLLTFSSMVGAIIAGPFLQKMGLKKAMP